MKILDTHQHLIYPDRFRYSWCKGIPALEGKNFRLDEYQAAASGTGISEALFMEVDVDEPQTNAETDFFLQLAADPKNGIAGVIAACRPEREDFPAQLEKFLHPKLKGVRRILHNQPDELSQSPLFAKNLSCLAEYGLTFDLCILSRQLPFGKNLVSKLPDVQFVLDHCGIPDIAHNALDPWRQHICDLSKFPNLACKISGVIAYCNPQRVNADAIRPFVVHCVECFGWDRVMFGGDWPVCNLTSSLARWVEILKEIVATESVANQEKLFYKNARRIYQIA
jgi:predicted TIM-barrel fold metal-dependent hydrolase